MLHIAAFHIKSPCSKTKKETYTHASSYRSDCRRLGSSEAGGGPGEAGLCGPWGASPWRSSRRPRVRLTEAGAAAG